MGFIILMISFSGYTTNKHINQRRYTFSLKEESQRKDKEARARLEEKNAELVESQKAAEAAKAAEQTVTPHHAKAGVSKVALLALLVALGSGAGAGYVYLQQQQQLQPRGPMQQQQFQQQVFNVVKDVVFTKMIYNVLLILLVLFMNLLPLLHL